jgi:hypothetical protein
MGRKANREGRGFRLSLIAPQMFLTDWVSK